ncbi:hypothetical protein CAPTEDRAFT_223901 [Capitella teleta]|uniref:Uncharacterized protein n=1 Tax=Capitella teleta TaxID=283909 RepID=R7UKJ9_CAPTE|nr:hypothetical protein CAPTEDRAFT_223901 [Capitella teleta]|eukprot:ELU04328.1 hypothetical protein CAPTEDRAFT_223901 [Capitella teleta]
MSQFDVIYRRFLLTKFFTKGWGDPENLKRIFDFRKILSNRDQCQQLVPKDYPIHIDKDEAQSEIRILHGHFKSPFVDQLPGIMPKEVETAKFQIILPMQWKSKLKPVCLHLAGTGDHGFGRRRMLLARPLLKEAGIASIILENPYYGVRKPKDQWRSSLRNVSDLFVMGGALILESLALLHWCERHGYGPLGITGISMGGHMASLAATNWHKPISLIPCLSWTTASGVFTQGVLSGAIPWKLLEDQYYMDSIYETEVASRIESPEWKRHCDSFTMGQDFARNYPQSLQDMETYEDHLEHGHYRPPEQFRLALNSNSVHLVSDVVSSKKIVAKRSEVSRKAALNFMRGVMDECTHLGNFCIPVDPSLIVILTAKHDAYMPRNNLMALHELWPGSEMRELDCGHIAAFLFKQKEFRKAIQDSFKLQIKKYL